MGYEISTVPGSAKHWQRGSVMHGQPTAAADGYELGGCKAIAGTVSIAKKCAIMKNLQVCAIINITSIVREGSR